MGNIIIEPPIDPDATLRLIDGVPAPTNPDGTLDRIGHELNFLEDFLGRLNKTMDEARAKAEIVSKLFSYSRLTRLDFIALGREHIGRKDDLFDRFLGQVWGYLSEIQGDDIMIIDEKLSKQIFEIYLKIVADFEKLKSTRYIRYWPLEIDNDKVIEDF